MLEEQHRLNETIFGRDYKNKEALSVTPRDNRKYLCAYVIKTNITAFVTAIDW